MIGRILVAILLMTAILVAQADDSVQSHEQQESHQTLEQGAEKQGGHEGEASEGHHSKKPAGWSVIPFVVLLLMIATGPLFYEHFWHKNYPKVAVVLAVMVVSYYLFVLHNHHGPVHAFFEYLKATRGQESAELGKW